MSIRFTNQSRPLLALLLLTVVTISASSCRKPPAQNKAFRFNFDRVLSFGSDGGSERYRR